MAHDDTPPDEPSLPEPEPAPRLADWWVWGMRKVAGVFADCLMISRGFIALFILFKLGHRALTRDMSELYQAGAGIVGLGGAWGIARLLGHFAWDRESPDPERWLAQRRQCD